MKRILVATDGSDGADQAVDFAIELCEEMGSALDVIAVRPHLRPGKGGPIMPITEIEQQHGAEHIAQRACDRAAEKGVTASPHNAFGDPADDIDSLGRQLGVDLIVVGSRGLGTLAGTLMGSVSRAVIKRSQIPVTVVRADAHAKVEA